MQYKIPVQNIYRLDIILLKYKNQSIITLQVYFIKLYYKKLTKMFQKF